MTEQPKIPPQAGGVPLGTTRAQCFTPLVQHASGQSTLAADGWTIKSLSGAAPAVAQDPSDASKLLVSVAGFYSFAVNYYLTFDSGSAPTFVDTNADYQGRVDDNPRWIDPTTSGSDLVQHYVFGPVYLPAGGWVGFGSNWPTLANAYINYFVVDVTRVG